MDQEKLKQVDAAWSDYTKAAKELDQKEWELYLKTIHKLDESEIKFVREHLSKFFS